MVGGEIDMLKGATFRVSYCMTQNQFEAILYSFKYTNVEAPQYKDPFHTFSHMLLMWNNNMDHSFVPLWITWIDYSISFWYNKYTCSGFMFVPRKPWPFWNKYHTICCGLLRILFGI